MTPLWPRCRSRNKSGIARTKSTCNEVERPALKWTTGYRPKKRSARHTASSKAWIVGQLTDPLRRLDTEAHRHGVLCASVSELVNCCTLARDRESLYS